MKVMSNEGNFELTSTGAAATTLPATPPPATIPFESTNDTLIAPLLFPVAPFFVGTKEPVNEINSKCPWKIDLPQGRLGQK